MVVGLNDVTFSAVAPKLTTGRRSPKFLPEMDIVISARTPVSPRYLKVSAAEFKIPTAPFQSRRRPVLATRKPPRLALRANLRDENVVMNVFSNEIFNQEDDRTRGTG
jgi:hypothetical protein